MEPVARVTQDGDGRQWFILGRWQQYEGETRANLLRIIGVGAFYAVHLATYYGLFGPVEMSHGITRPFHQAVTSIALAWVALAMADLLCLKQRVFPSELKYFSTGGDMVLLTGLLMVADGPRSPLVVGYFLVIALAGLRFSLALVWFATAGSMAGYLVVLGFARWFATRALAVPRYHQIIFLLALALSGVMLGQILRRVRRLAEDYAARTTAGQGGRS